MTLPERPGLLHAVPLLDLFVLLWLFFLLGPALLRQSGMMVELPPSRFQLERFQDTQVITLGRGEDGPRIHLGRNAMTFAELEQSLTQMREDGAVSETLVLLKTDGGTPVGTERQVSEMVLGMGFRLAMVGANEPVPAAETPKSSAE